MSLRLASEFPDLHFVVQDLGRVVASGPSQVPIGLENRVTFMAHDFLTEQPVKNADVFLFRWVLHNWSDTYCIRILRNLIPALKKDAIILVNDNVLPEPGLLGLWQEGIIRYVGFCYHRLSLSRPT